MSNNEVATLKVGGVPALQMNEAELLKVLKSSLYPGAADESIKMVLGYCKAAGYDPMQKPVHIVPMWDNKAGRMRDVIMPGVGLYRTQAARTGQFAGMTEPEFGPDVTETIGGMEVTYPQWCRVTVKRQMANGAIAEFSAREFWKENYAVRGGQEKSIAPNAMWAKRVYGQLAKCAQAQALRLAFPEATGADATADEMDGKELNDAAEFAPTKPAIQKPQARTEAPQERPPIDVTPEPVEPPAQAPTSTTIVKASPGQIKMVRSRAERAGFTTVEIAERYKVATLDELTVDAANDALAYISENAKQ